MLQVETLCWCGARATHNARTVNGIMVLEGEQVAVGDVGMRGSGKPDGANGSDGSQSGDENDELGYEVLCRKHHRARLSSAQSRSGRVAAV